MKQQKSRFLFLIPALHLLDHNDNMFEHFEDHIFKVILCNTLAGVYRNSWSAPSIQIARFVSNEILALGHCKNFSLHHVYSQFYCSFPEAKLLDLFQIAVGLMVCQQLGGINGVCFYVSDIFEQAGIYIQFQYTCLYLFHFPECKLTHLRKILFSTSGFSPDIGTITYAILQVLHTYCDNSWNISISLSYKHLDLVLIYRLS